MFDMKLFSLLLFLTINCRADEVMVNTLGQGSCWFQNKESIKVTSFNDHQSVNTTLNQIQASLIDLLPMGSKELSTLHLHCGPYGASFVARLKSDNGNFCLWAMLDHGKFKTRSLGASLDSLKDEAKLCDGFKQGELLITLKNHQYIDQLKNEKWSSLVKEIIPVAFDIYKIKLTKEYFLREEEAAKMFQESFGLLDNQVEFNQYQHGVGEYVQLK
jgi:hypothetical protein